MNAPSAFVTRSRPPASQTPPAPAPEPLATVAKPWQITDPAQAVVAAFLTGDHGFKSVSDLVELTHLSRGDVCSVVATLATAGRAERVINDYDSYVIVRWSLKR